MRGPTLVAAALLLAAHLAASAPASPEAAPGWQAKADGHLLAALADGEGPWTLVVQGPPLPAPAQAPADRGTWRAHWALHAAPFREAMRAEVARLGGEVTSEAPAVNAAHVRLAGARVPELLARAEVRRAGLDWQGATSIDQGGSGAGATLADSLAKLQAPDLWALGYRGEGVSLAVLDTGIRGTHDTMRAADGATRVAAWFDATAEPCAGPCDAHGHGTHVASTAAGGDLFNASAPKGAAPRATVLGVRIFIGDTGTWEDAQQGLQAAFDLGAEVATNSWGGACGGDATVAAELAEALADAGMLSVFASGNSGAGNVRCPGVVEKLVTVGAVHATEAIAGFSSRGPCAWANATRTCPDVVAVGVDLVAASHACDTCYVGNTGTSMAAPQVGGLVALLQQAKLALRGAGLDAGSGEADALLRFTARDVALAGVDDDAGWGLPQAKAALDALAGGAAGDVRGALGTGRAVVRVLQGAVATFGVANFGAAPVTGRLVHTVAQVDTGLCPPACDTVTVADEALTLAQGEARTSSFLVEGAARAPGTFRVTGTFEFTYTDPADGLTKDGSVARSQTLVVKKVAWLKQRAVPGELAPGTLVGGLALRNLGNEDASNVRVTENFDLHGFAPVPRVPPAPGLPGGLLADPAPGVMAHHAQQRVTYTWFPGAVPQGTTWTASYTLAGTLPGTYTFQGTLQYLDGVGNSYQERLDQTATVRLP